MRPDKDSSRKLYTSIRYPAYDVAHNEVEATRNWPPPGAWWSDDKTRRKQAELENMIVPAIARLVDRAAAR